MQSLTVQALRTLSAAIREVGPPWAYLTDREPRAVSETQAKPQSFPSLDERQTR